MLGSLLRSGSRRFELHFWRKKCKHCDCSREEHNVDYVPGWNRPKAKFIQGQDDHEEEVVKAKPVKIKRTPGALLHAMQPR